MKRYIKSTESNYDDYFETAKAEALEEATSLQYNRKFMKCSKKEFLWLKSEWVDSISDAQDENDLAFSKEFYLSEIYKKKYSPLI